MVGFSLGDEGKLRPAEGKERAELDKVKLTGRSPQSLVTLNGESTSFVYRIFVYSRPSCKLFCENEILEITVLDYITLPPLWMLKKSATNIPGQLEFVATPSVYTAAQPGTRTDTGLRFAPYRIVDVAPFESFFGYRFHNSILQFQTFSVLDQKRKSFFPCASFSARTVSFDLVDYHIDNDEGPGASYTSATMYNYGACIIERVMTYVQFVQKV